jgi:hypothetical protein
MAAAVDAGVECFMVVVQAVRVARRAIAARRAFAMMENLSRVRRAF